MSAVVGEQRYVIPGDVVVPISPVGKSLAMPYGVYGRMPERTTEDALRSVKKYVAEVLDELGAPFLTGLDDNGNEETSTAWEVRLWDEGGTFHYPFARVSAVGPDTVVGPALYADVTQAMTVHLYPYRAPDSEQAILLALRLRHLIGDALKFGAARGRELLIPLFDYAGKPDLAQGSEARLPYDWLRVEGLTTEHMVDPEDDTHAMAIANFRATWRRVPRFVPGYLIESVRMAAHPS